MPLHESPNDQNELTPDAQGDNYWGYSTSNFFAPERRYAADRSSGGPTRELRAMIGAFHAQGIKVLVDVVYNHTSEGGAGGNGGTNATVLSFRGLDNAAFYELGNDAHGYANACTRGCYRYEKNGLLQRIATDLPARPDGGGAGADLIAEPWGIAAGSYQVGAFPKSWSE